MSERTRFAPSPTGFLHVGGLRTALYSFLYAKAHQGKFILRIEDTDQKRSIKGAKELIYQTLADSLIIPDEGPLEGGTFGPYIQSERKNIYVKYALELVEKKKAYYCFCQKERLQELKTTNKFAKYDKHCLSLSEDKINEMLKSKIPYVIRQNISNEGETSYEDLVYGKITVPNYEMEDQILLKSDKMPTYNFANVVDDHLMQLTCVLRGQEYLSSTPKYVLLYQAFGWEVPKFGHLSQIMKDHRKKLSKRYGDANFNDFIEKGYLPSAIVNYIALLGWTPKINKEKFSLEELINEFSISGLAKANVIFDENKLKWLNSEYIKEMEFDVFMKHARPFFDKSIIKDKYDYNIFGRMFQSRIMIFSDIIEKVKFIDIFGEFDLNYFNNEKLKIDLVKVKILLPLITNRLKDLDKWDEENIHNTIIKCADENNIKTGVIYTILRIALTSQNVTPGGCVEVGLILGKKDSIKRLETTIKYLK